jgi:two-component sensor histidine kinase
LKVSIVIHKSGAVPPDELQSTVPLGLILLELITNAYRHAYPDGGQGQVNPILKMMADECLNMMIKDSGIGFNASGNDSSGGIAVARSLPQHIGAKLESCSSGEGTLWKPSLP